VVNRATTSASGKSEYPEPVMLEPSDEAYAAVRSLRVVRSYTSEPIGPETLDQILEAGRWTGSSKNVQGWRLVVVGDPAERALIASAGRYTQPVRDAAVVVCLVETTPGNEFDIGRLAQNLMLAAATRGIGSCPVTLHEADRARELLRLAQTESCRYAVALGHVDPVGEVEQRRERRARGVAGRKPAADIVRRGL
jgi:nitroreductase